jgi:hypothetical protein
MAEARNYATVLALRILLGCAQAYVQFLTVYISLWYKRDEVAFRTGTASLRLVRRQPV